MRSTLVDVAKSFLHTTMEKPLSYSIYLVSNWSDTRQDSHTMFLLLPKQSALSTNKVSVQLEDEKETARNRMKYHVDKEAE